LRASVCSTGVANARKGQLICTTETVNARTGETVRSTGAVKARLGDSVRSAEVANDVAVFPLQRQLSPFACIYYFGSDLWRSPSNRCGPSKCIMFLMTYGCDCGSGGLPNRDASYTPFAESATPATRLIALKLRRQLHVCRRRLRSRTGTLWCARCWVSDARLLLVSSTASSQISAQNRRAER